jgi:hypothetical protein
VEVHSIFACSAAAAKFLRMDDTFLFHLYSLVPEFIGMLASDKKYKMQV